MPVRAPRICSCGKVVPSGAICPCQAARKRETDKQYDRKRGNSSQRGYNGTWERKAKAFLAHRENRQCKWPGCPEPARHVDHIIAHKGDPTLRDDPANWQGLALGEQQRGQDRRRRLMLYPTAGSRLFIADVPLYGGMTDDGWVEIGETEAIGFLGSQWDVATADIADDCDSDAIEIAAKGIERRPEMPIIMGNDPTDPGQLLLWQAARSHDSYAFRLVFPDGVTARSWSALVIRIGEVFDTANSVMKLQADLKPTSATERG